MAVWGGCSHSAVNSPWLLFDAGNYHNICAQLFHLCQFSHIHFFFSRRPCFWVFPLPVIRPPSHQHRIPLSSLNRSFTAVNGNRSLMAMKIHTCLQVGFHLHSLLRNQYTPPRLSHQSCFWERWVGPTVNCICLDNLFNMWLQGF